MTERMTAKRFTIQDERVLKDNQKYVAENGYVFSYKSDAEEVCELLNELHEENQRLKKENKSLIDGIKNTARQGADFTVKVWQSKSEVKTINGGYYD